MTNYPQLVIISPEIILILQNMLIYALFIDCSESIYALFVAKSTSVPKLGGGGGVGGGGLSQFWQCQDLESAYCSKSSPRHIAYIKDISSLGTLPILKRKIIWTQILKHLGTREN